jgi:hypothetical protein
VKAICLHKASLATRHKYQRQRTLVTATWNVHSVTGRGVLLEMELLISMLRSAALCSSQPMFNTLLTNIMEDFEEGGKADAKSHSSSCAVVSALPTGCTGSEATFATAVGGLEGRTLEVDC